MYILAAINVTADGSYTSYFEVWSGCGDLTASSYLGDTCQAWTTDEASYFGITGDPSFTSSWFYHRTTNVPCDSTPVRLLCLQE
jgi:hypothetical protein